MREDDYYYRYFNMRMQQFEILERMIPLAAFYHGHMNKLI